MKNRILIIVSFLIVAIAMAGAVYAPPTFHTILGYCEDADDGTLANGSTVTAYIESNPGEKLYDIVGTGGQSKTSSYWEIDIISLSPDTGDILIVEVNKTVGTDEYLDVTRVIVDSVSFQTAPDMKLKKWTDPYIALVMGKITDISTAVEIEDADVYVECLVNVENVETTSDSFGNYYAVLSCPMGATVRVTATKTSESGSNMGMIEQVGTAGTTVDVGIAIVDVSIPEFPIVALPLMFSLLCFGAIRRRTF